MKAKNKLYAILTFAATFYFINVATNAQVVVKSTKIPVKTIIGKTKTNIVLPQVPKYPVRPIGQPLINTGKQHGGGINIFGDSAYYKKNNANIINMSLQNKALQQAMKKLDNIKERIEKNKKLLKALTTKYENRFLNYVKINSQSVDTADMNAFPMTSGQIKMAEYLENELRGICKESNAVITRSADQYVYVKIPSNITNKSVPSIMFMAHLDVTPEAPGQNIKPIVHENYNGGDIKLPAGIVLSPETPQGAHLKNCNGKTIITSDGSTLLGVDDKAGVTILVGLVEILVKNKKIQHGDVYMVFSQNEDIGRAAYRFETKYVDGSPDIVIDVDGNTPDKFSVENFTASMIIYHFHGNEAHPSEGFTNKYGDALTAASYFIGQLDPSKHPSASKDKQGYIHCYSMVHPTDSTGKEISEDYLVKIRLRYFDKNEGDTLRQMLHNAERLVADAYPFVKTEAGTEMMQYENIAYTMYPGTTELIINSAAKYGMTMSPSSERSGTTSAMMAAKGLRGGPCIYSAQQAAHSVYEWVCVEDMVRMMFVTLDIVRNVSSMKK